jgi:RNA polymerase sigma factor (sigma-70 family)
MMEDWQLLREYVEQHSEAAFRELMGRHLDLVYAAASRRLGNAQAAEDVTQSVFCLLARKAPQLHPNGSLVGWLYQTACYMASKHQDREIRRQRREQEAVMALTDDPSEEANWEQIRPVLDEAMHQLSEPERNLLLLRFFKDSSFQETGRSAGISEDAARMRIHRTLDKLRELLRQRGVSSTTAALAAMLDQKAIEAAPTSASQSIQTAVMKALATARVPSLSQTLFKVMKQSPLLATFIIGSALLLGLITTLRCYNRAATPTGQTEATQRPTFSPAHKEDVTNPAFPSRRPGTRKAGTPSDTAASATTEAQVNIECHFIEMPAATANSSKLLNALPNSIVGSLTDEQFRILINDLDATTGVDVMAFPNVTTVDGRRAHFDSNIDRSVLFAQTINATTNHPYGNLSVNEITYEPAGDSQGIVTNKISTGLSIDVTPYVQADNSIRLTIIPSVVDFLGYQASFNDPDDQSPHTAVPPSPTIRTIQLSSETRVFSGQTVVLGPDYFDKKPVHRINGETQDPKEDSSDSAIALDAPASTPIESNKKALYFFVTVRLIDRAGNPFEESK